MSSVQNILLSRFLTLYGEPKTDNVEAFFGEYEKALSGTAPDVLQGAADLVIREQEFRSWPTPGECVKACNKIAFKLDEERRHRRPSQADLDRQAEVWPQPSEESKQRVKDLVADVKRSLSGNDQVSRSMPVFRRDGLTETSKRIMGEGE